MASPIVSIIMPVYNSKKYIKKTLQSIKHQTFKNWKLIIVDDCSNDNSSDVIKKELKGFEEKYQIIKLNKNSGVSTARNTALRHIDTKYIAYIDSDDIWNIKKLEKQIAFMEKNKYDFTYTYFSYYIENKKDKKTTYMPKQLNYKQALKNTAILTSTVIINIQKIDKKLLQMPDVKLGQDSATWWNVLKDGHTAHCLNEYLTKYTQNKMSLSNNKINSVKGTWKLYRKIEKLSLLKSLFLFICYSINATLRRVI